MIYEVSESILIRGTPPTVFAALADPRVQVTYDGEMYKSTELLTPEPIAKGSRFRGVFKGMGTVEYEYSQYARHRIIEHAVAMPMGDLRHRFEFVAEEGSITRLIQTATLSPNVLGRVLWGVVLRRQLSTRLKTLNGLVKRFVERDTK